jgi:hypothetical protein
MNYYENHEKNHIPLLRTDVHGRSSANGSPIDSSSRIIMLVGVKETKSLAVLK